MENFIFCAVLGGFEIYWSVRWKCALSVIYLKMAMNLTLKHKNGVKTVFFMVLLKSEYIHKPDIIGIPVFGYPLNCTKFHRQFWQFLVNILLWKFDAWFLKKRNENYEKKNVWWKTKKRSKKHVSAKISILYSDLATLTLICSILQTLERWRKYIEVDHFIRRTHSSSCKTTK